MCIDNKDTSTCKEHLKLLSANTYVAFKHKNVYLKERENFVKNAILNKLYQNWKWPLKINFSANNSQILQKCCKLAKLSKLCKK